MEIPLGWFETLIGVIAAGFVGWFVRLEKAIDVSRTGIADTLAKANAVALDLAKNYHDKEELREAFKAALDPLKQEVQQLRQDIRNHRE